MSETRLLRQAAKDGSVYIVVGAERLPSSFLEYKYAIPYVRSVMCLERLLPQIRHHLGGRLISVLAQALSYPFSVSELLYVGF